MKLDVTITKTSIGTADYIQIISDDQICVNIVLVAEEIKVVDHRKPKRNDVMNCDCSQGFKIYYRQINGEGEALPHCSKCNRLIAIKPK